MVNANDFPKLVVQTGLTWTFIPDLYTAAATIHRPESFILAYFAIRFDADVVGPLHLNKPLAPTNVHWTFTEFCEKYVRCSTCQSIDTLFRAEW